MWLSLDSEGKSVDWLDVAQAEDGRNLELPVITSIWQGHGSRISTSVGLSTGHLPTESQTLVYIYIYITFGKLLGMRHAWNASCESSSILTLVPKRTGMGPNARVSTPIGATIT